ncbi:aldehyde dehydrogenase family protein [Echinicola salinicaeni]|uniref:aldehyde dehydrogenase family protein n=1 Tax=Echinicola salinicaeni TaxID=2762757 RepID=UPI00164529F9|nr:aldehyde dehydrogenase family protein [Echinicola salinicaeni]
MTAPITLQELSNTFSIQKIKAYNKRYSTAEERIATLKKLREWIKKNQQEISKAIYADFKKPATEVAITETAYVLMEINHAIKNLASWMKPKKVTTPLYFLGSKSYTIIEPKGQALIIAPWNFPFNLSIGPLVSALAAGCTVCLKPSELTPHTSALVRRLCMENFEKDEVAIFEGDAEMAKQLLALPFDHIFFTGSPGIGKMVMNAAAQHLSSVTLELGGKSPVVIDKNYDLNDAVPKIATGKWINCGQTCIAPDFLFVHESQKERLLDDLSHQIQKMYPTKKADKSSNKDYGRIISRKHLNRLQHLLTDAQTKGATIRHGGEIKAEENFMEPTIVTGMTEEMLLMKEEIFGPILPIITYSKTEDILNYMSHKAKPLAFYLFSEDKSTIEMMQKSISAGTMAINVCGIQYLQNSLPFGGTKESGMGKAHGYAGFLTFSNEKAVLKQRKGKTPLNMFYPPYDLKTNKIIAAFLNILAKN